MAVVFSRALAIDIDGEIVWASITEAIAADGGFRRANVHCGVVLQDEMHIAAGDEGLIVVERAVGHIPACRECGFRAVKHSVFGTQLPLAVLVEVGNAALNVGKELLPIDG